MSPVAVNLGGQYEYVLEEEKKSDPKDQTIFLLRPLKWKELSEIQDRTGYLTQSGEFRALAGTITTQTVIAGLVGWSNFNDAQGQPVEFKKNGGVCHMDNLDLLAPDHLNELCNAISERGFLTRQEVKNLKSEQSSTAEKSPGPAPIVSQETKP